MSLELDDDLPPVEVDTAYMGEVLHNLIANARESMPDGGEVTLSTERVTIVEGAPSDMPDARPGKFVRLTVRDTGVGMAPETLTMAFEPFFSTKEGGTGMGLPVVHGLVRQHEGWLHVASTPGRGTHFHIYLTEKGFEVFAAANASDAQAMFDREGGRFDLVFSDVVLPDGNGVDLTQSFLAARPGLPVLLTSGYADHLSQWNVIQERGLDFMRKPYTPSELLRRMRDLMVNED